MTSTATIIEDSISESGLYPGIRIVTMHVRTPRMILSEFNTHRVFSRNSRSSRAVPVMTMLKELEDNPYIPHFMQNMPGMQAREELTPEAYIEANEVWLDMIEACMKGVRRLNELKVHKQHANRPTEWFGYTDILVTSTSWRNFDVLRDDDAAQPEIQDLAKLMKKARDASTPKMLKHGEWHLPYILPEERSLPLDIQQKLSTARCARLSYKPFDGDASHEKELARYEKLMGEKIKHASPGEHQATPDTHKGEYEWNNPSLHGNFTGWIQFRKTIPGEYFPD